MNNEIALYSFLFLAILFILPGIREIIQRKAKIMGNYRTPRIVTRKYAVFAGIGRVIYGTSFIFIYISSKFYKFSGLIYHLVLFLLIISGTLIHFYLGRRDPNIIEEEKTDREIIKQKDKDPEVRKNRTKSLLLAALIAIVLGTGMNTLLFPLIDKDIDSTSEMISIFLFCSFGLSVMAFLSILRYFFYKKDKWGNGDEYTTSFIVGIGRRAAGELPTATDFTCHPTNMIALLQILSIDANCFFHV